MRQVFLDTETTGLDAAQGDRIVELGCIEMVNRRLTGRRLHHYLNPERSSHPDALRVHGLSDEFLADKPRFGEVASALCEFIRGAELIIHNAAFDVGFLDAELTRLSLPTVAALAERITDSLSLAREMYPGKANSLDALCKRLEVDNSQRELHGALLDSGLLAEVYIRMTRGQGSLVAEEAQAQAGTETGAARADLRRYELPLLSANEDEQAAHQVVLAEMAKGNGGRVVWRDAEPQEAPAAMA